MKKQKEGRYWVFTSQREAKQKMQELEEYYEVVEKEVFSANTAHHGTIPIFAVFFNKERPDDDW